MRTTLILILVALPVLSTTIHVPADQPTIQAGIEAASAGDTVLVACDTYYEHDVIMKSGVYLTSETGSADCVVIDAMGEGRVFLCDGLDSDTIIEGVTITGGAISGDWPDISGGGFYCQNSDFTLIGCVISHNSGNYYGGGIYFNGCSAVLEDCTINGNHASSGGGMYCWNTSVLVTNCYFSENSAISIGGMACMENSSPTLTGCTFIGNTSTGGGGAVGCYYNSSPMIIDCSFSANISPSGGGGLGCFNSSPDLLRCTFDSNEGGGMYCYESNSTLTGCVFSRNVSTYFGAGMSCYSNSSPTLSGCTFQGNTASFYGGGLSCTLNSSPLLENCTFVDNGAQGGGGAIFCNEYSTPQLFNSIIAFNLGSAAIHCISSSCPSLTCCDIYGNMGGDWVGEIAYQYEINGNVSSDPYFCDHSANDYSLDTNSPCAPANNECEILMGAWPVGCTSVENITWSRIKVLF